ncbi:Carrier protein, mitochondrial [Coemansia sp. RSA 552]|nr:Carrier protein, mitochondrial [Coemansia sp. RSA 552]
MAGRESPAGEEPGLQSKIASADGEPGLQSKIASAGEEPGLQSKIVSACSGAVATSLLMTPFDVVKTRQQSQTLVRADPLLPAVREWKTHRMPRNARVRESAALYGCDTGKLAGSAGSLRTSVSLCVCTDQRLARDRAFFGGGDRAVKGGNVAETWRRLYQELIATPYAQHQQSTWQKLVSTGDTVVPERGRRITGTLAGMRHIAQTEGVGRLWRGLTPTLVASGPSTVIYFVGYDYLRQWMGRQMRRRPRWAPHEKYAALAAGCVARTAAVAAIAPIELVRTRMQASATHDFRTVMQHVADEIRHGGPRILWRGLVPTLWRDVPFSAAYWFGYERWREGVYAPLFLPDGAPQGLTARLATAFCSGASSGVVAAALTTPFDVAKTRRQIDRTTNPRATAHSLIHVIRDIVHADGPRGLFAGLAPRLMKVVPSCAIMISSYELGKLVLGS